MTFDENKLVTYRTRLESEKQKLLEDIRRNEKPEDFGSDVDAGDEEANEAAEFSNQLAINQSLRERVNEIDAALSRMNVGTYGLCERCNRMISPRVLDVAPESQFCEQCKRANA